MSLKLLELQVALPRTHEFGKMTNELNQKGQVYQEQLAVSKQKEDIIKNKQVTKKGENEKLRLHRERNQNESREGQKKKKESSSKKHPTKGKNIDISG